MSMSLAHLKQLLLRRYMLRLGRRHERLREIPAQVRKVGLWQFGGVGDMLLATPVIQALAEMYPQARVHVWCSEPKFADFLMRFDNVEAVHDMDIYAWDTRTLLRRDVRQATCRMAESICNQQLDLLINLHVPALLDWWAVEWWLIENTGSRFTLGFDPEFAVDGSVYDVSLAATARQGIHYTELYSRLLAQAGITCVSRTRFPISDAERRQAGELLQAAGIKADAPWVCLHAGARRLAMIGRQWPASRFAELAGLLHAQGVQTLLIGVDSEQSLADEIMQLAPSTCTLVGRTDLFLMAAVIAAADAFVGQDSGPFHVAVSQGVPAIALCGRQDAEPHYLAYEQSNVHALIRPSPDLIMVDDVWQKLVTCLPVLSSGLQNE